MTEAANRAAAERQVAKKAVRRAIYEIDKRRERLVSSLEHLETPDPEFTRDGNARAAQLGAERAQKQSRLDELESSQPIRQCPDLVDQLPVGRVRSQCGA